MLYRSLLLTGICILAFSLRGEVVDNSSLLPKWVDDSKVNQEALTPGAAATPDWVKSLILVEVNVLTASEDGTFAGMDKVLDHLAETGVNGIWLTPVNEGRHYGNFGLHTLNRELTGTDDTAEQWKRIRDFTDKAHRRNIRVFLDVVSWGVTRTAPLFREKPEWFSGPSRPEWNGWLWDWTNKELREWFSSRLTELVMTTGIDGIRCDSSPGFAAYGPYRVAKERLLAFGRKPVLISEHPSERRGVFDFDQLPFMYEGGLDKPGSPCRLFMTENIVDVIRSGAHFGNVDSQFTGNGITLDGGRERYYSFPLSNHDNRRPQPPFNAVEFGYQALFSPMIPIWYLGAEWHNPVDGKGWSWDLPVRWDLLDDERDFFELVKKMIRIRRSYPEIFEYFPGSIREANICKVETDQAGELQAYARYRDGKAILIVPNSKEKTTTFRISIPYRDAQIAAGDVTVTDLLNNKQVASGRPASFEAEIPAKTPGIYLVAAKNGAPAIEKDGLRATFADPSDEKLGFRFFRAGWVRGLYPATGEESIFHTQTLFDYHPAFGCAQEFLPDLPLSSGDRLKIGVGVFHPHPKDYFCSRTVESFPWKWEITGQSLVAHQSCTDHEGYAYELSVSVTAQKNCLIWKQQLTNTGSRRIDGSVYLHPFFKTPDGFGAWWYALDGIRHSVADAPEEQSVDGSHTQVAAGTASLSVSIRSDTPFRRRDFWRNKSNAFAVEPYIPVSLAPGETRGWSWTLSISQHQT